MELPCRRDGKESYNRRLFCSRECRTSNLPQEVGFTCYQTRIISVVCTGLIHSTDMRDPAGLADEIESIQNRCMNIQHTYYIALFTFISYITSALLIYPSKTADWQSTELVTNKFSIFAQVNITNPTS